MACAAANVPCLGMINDREAVPFVGSVIETEPNGNGRSISLACLDCIQCAICTKIQKYSVRGKERITAGSALITKRIVRHTEYRERVVSYALIYMLTKENVNRMETKKGKKSKRINSFFYTGRASRARIFT